MRIYPICIVPFPLMPFFSMVLVRLFGNSWKWYRSRRCFAEWIFRVDQFGEMSMTQWVVHAETNRSGASGKRRFPKHFALPRKGSSCLVLKTLIAGKNFLGTPTFALPFPD